jgi:hypothetical protein
MMMTMRRRRRNIGLWGDMGGFFVRGKKMQKRTETTCGALRRTRNTPRTPSTPQITSADLPHPPAFLAPPAWFPTRSACESLPAQPSFEAERPNVAPPMRYPGREAIQHRVGAEIARTALSIRGQMATAALPITDPLADHVSCLRGRAV